MRLHTVLKRLLLLVVPLLFLIFIVRVAGERLQTTEASSSSSNQHHCSSADEDGHVQPSSVTTTILVKIGGSSITNKAVRENLNSSALEWFASTLKDGLQDSDTKKMGHISSLRWIVIHGAGSFGHFQAKEYGFRGSPPSLSSSENSAETGCSPHEKDDDNFAPNNCRNRGAAFYQHQRMGLAHTRQSVQTLNRHVVSSLLSHDLPAISISPCFALDGDRTTTGYEMNQVLGRTLHAGFIPVLHGDACWYEEDRTAGIGRGVGIVSGDTLMTDIGESCTIRRQSSEMHVSIDRVLFLTDVDGIYTADPRTDPAAQLLPEIQVDVESRAIRAQHVVEATGSSHAHDVTGGLRKKLQAAVDLALSTRKDVWVAKFGSVTAKQLLTASKASLILDNMRGTRIHAVE